MSKHTPGPWMAHHDHGWLVVESDNGELYVKVEKGAAAKKHMADARLIAAAPDLLEALKLMVEQFTKGSGHSTLKDSEARIKAHAAIAKATGETQ